MIKLNLVGYKSELINRLTDILSKLSDRNGMIGVRVVPAEKVRALNRDYAGRDEATDVLSFPYAEGESGEQHDIGDIVINAEQLKSQAIAADTSEETEFILLLLHGCLHLLGYDHQTAAQQQELDRLQQEVMQQLGLEYRNFNWRQ